MAFCKHPLGDTPECTQRQMKMIMRGRKNRWDLLAEELQAIFSEIEIADCYSDKGQWGIHPVRCCILLLLQAIEGLTDRQAAEAVQLNVGWRLVLRLPMDHPGFSHSVLSKARKRFEECDNLVMFLDSVLKRAHSKGMLNVTKQRADATFIIGCVRALNRIELILETVRNAAEELAQFDPEWFAKIAKDIWIQRYYIDRPFNYKLPKDEKSRTAIAETAAGDGFFILDAVGKSGPKKTLLMGLQSIKTLETVLEQQFHPRDKNGNAPKFRSVKELPPSGERIISPHETEARIAVKGKDAHRGYKTHLTETCVPGYPNLITQVHTTNSTLNDSLSLPDILQSLIARGLKPTTLLVDRGYSNVQNLLDCAKTLGIDVVTLTTGHSWQSIAGKGFDNTQFRIDWKNKIAICPNNKASTRWKKQKEDTNIYFSPSDCSSCPFKEDCTKAKFRVLRLKSEELWTYMQRMREREKTTGFRGEYRKRAGVEGTVSEFIRHAGRNAKVRGQNKVTIKSILGAAAINVSHMVNWALDRIPATTRVGRAEKILAARAS